MNSAPEARTAPWYNLVAHVAGRRPLSEHEREIHEFFQGKVTSTDAEGSISPRPAVLICFTNRCGSNYFAELLETTGMVNRGREFFNWPFVTNLSRKRGIDSFPEYCQRISEIYRPQDRHWATKVTLDHLLMLLRTGIVPNVYYPVQFVFVERRDVLEQAISFSIAAQTQQWSSRHQDPGREPEFDPEDIRRRCAALQRTNAEFQRLFAVLGLSAHVVYEDLCADPVQAVQNATGQLSFGPVSPRPQDCKLGMQRTERNRDFKRRMLELQEKSSDSLNA